MGLSGCEDEEANEHFVEKLLQRYNPFAKSGIAVSDTIGSIYTACPDGERDSDRLPHEVTCVCEQEASS